MVSDEVVTELRESRAELGGERGADQVPDRLLLFGVGVVGDFELFSVSGDWVWGGYGGSG